MIFLIYNKLYKQEKNAVTKQKSQYLYCYIASVSAQMKVEQLAIHLDKKLLISETSCSEFPITAAQILHVIFETGTPVFTGCWYLCMFLHSGQEKEWRWEN